jgi:hypothetical protein
MSYGFDNIDVLQKAARRQRGRGGQGGNLVKCAGKLNRRLDQCRALKRPLSRLTPQTCGLLDLPGLGAVTR